MQVIVGGRWNRHDSTRPEAKTLWAIRNRHATGESIGQELREAEDALIKCLLAELEGCGVSALSDGGIRWDSLYDVTRRIEGCNGFSQLTRIPGTNHFHRQPVATSPLLRGTPLLLDDLRFAKFHTRLPIVMSLPGPYSAALQTENCSAIGLGELSLEYAEVFEQEIACLIANGAAMVRIEEPHILSHPEDFAFFRILMQYLTAGLDRSKVALAVGVGDCKQFRRFFELPFGVFWVDFVEGRANAELLKDFPKEKRIVAGIVDARHTYQESKEEIVDFLFSRVVPHVSKERLMISSNTDLHYLPWDTALEKVEDLALVLNMCEDRMLIHTLRSQRTPFSKEAASHRSGEPLPLLETASRSSRHPQQVTPDVAFKTSAVGSFPQPQELREARKRLRNGMLDEQSYRFLVEHYVREWMRFQEEIDLTIPVGGEFLREDMAVYFGVGFGGRVRDFVPSYENRRYRPIEYFESVRFRGPITLDDFLFCQSLTTRMVKETITGPATLADWGLLSHEPYYHDRRRFRMELAAELRHEIESLIRGGVRVLQLDEPALTTKMENFFVDLSAISETVRGCDDIYLILHICYSDMEALDAAFPHILQLPFHQIHVEMANRNWSLLQLVEKYGFGGKDIGLGVIDVHTNRIETIDEIVRGVERTLDIRGPDGSVCFSPDTIWLTPDCGLKERSTEVAKTKLRVISEAAAVCRERFSVRPAQR